MPRVPTLYHKGARKTITEEQIGRAMDAIAKKDLDVPELMYDMQNSSTVDYHNADLRQWLAGMTDYGYSTLIERLARMLDRKIEST
jgi:hypothetical protein